VRARAPETPMGDAAAADPSAKIDALGRFLLATHPNEPAAESARPWLLRPEPSCTACLKLRAALRLEPVPAPAESRTEEPAP
jgi:hypothetical protein